MYRYAYSGHNKYHSAGWWFSYNIQPYPGRVLNYRRHNISMAEIDGRGHYLDKRIRRYQYDV
jgi:hypothetical protein